MSLSVLSGFLFIPDLIGSSLNLPDSRDDDIHHFYGPTEFANSMEKDLYNSTIFVVDKLYGYAECKDEAEIRKSEFANCLHKALKDVKDKLADLGKKYDWLSLRNIEIDYNGRKTSETKNSNDKIMMRPMKHSIDNKIRACGQKMREQIDEHLIPLSKKFKDEYFIQKDAKVELDFDEIINIREDLDEDDLEDIVAYIFAVGGGETGYNYDDAFRALQYGYEDKFSCLRNWEIISKVWKLLKSEPMQDVMQKLNQKGSGKWGEAFKHYNALFDLDKKGVIGCFLEAYDIADMTMLKEANMDNCDYTLA